MLSNLMSLNLMLSDQTAFKLIMGGASVVEESSVYSYAIRLSSDQSRLGQGLCDVQQSVI